MLIIINQGVHTGDQRWFGLKIKTPVGNINDSAFKKKKKKLYDIRPGGGKPKHFSPGSEFSGFFFFIGEIPKVNSTGDHVFRRISDLP